MTFKDHFSKQSEDYTRFRPIYPQSLYAWLASITQNHHHVWDCATGNGQAAVALANYFDKVAASDASENQILHAKQHPKVRYFTAPAERSGLEESSMDMISVAQAFHWFQFEAFFSEARRVLKPGGILAIWAYGFLTIDKAVDNAVNSLYKGALESHWPPERRYIEEEYATIPFPFQELQTPDFFMEAQWSQADLTGYLRTWSAVVRYKEEHGSDPVDAVEAQIKDIWGNEVHRSVRWPIYLRVGAV